MTNIPAMRGDLVFVDTSGLLALLDGDDQFHSAAIAAWQSYSTEADKLWISDYVRLETWAITLRRLGAKAVLDFRDHILPLCQIHFVGEAGFESAAEKWRLARRRNLSLVDITSFDCMRRLDITKAFAFDKHFQEEGFQTP